jgi:hypothetical protein
MKTKNIFSFAVLAIALAACSNDNDVNTVSPSQKGKIVTLTATISQGNASTRTLTDNNDGTISSAWEVGTEMEVWYHSTTSENRVMGKATITQVDGDGKATITAELTDPKNDTGVDFQYPYGYHGGPIHNDQKGTLDLINQKCDSQGGGGRLTVNGDKASLPGNVHIEHHNCILKLTLSDGTNDITSKVTKIEISNIFIDNGNTRDDHYTLSNLNLPSQGPFYVAIEPRYDYSNGRGTVVPVAFTFTAYTEDGIYSISKSDVTFERGKLYTIMPLALSKSNGDGSLQAPDKFVNGGNPFASN